MPLPQRWNTKRKQKPPPPGFDYVEPVLEALEHELRDVVQENDPTKRKTQAMWPVHQINWQKSRYIYDLYHVHHKISKQVYQYCVNQKYVDAALIAKWKKPGYERLCSTYVINPSNYKFGSTSICRVPWKDRAPEQRGVHDPTTGCLGCASTEQHRNIFGNKYGQYLAAIQLAREARLERKERQRERALQVEQETAAREHAQAELKRAQDEAAQRAEEEADESDDDDDDDEGPKPAAAPATNAEDPDGDAPTDDDDDAETDDDDDDDDFGPSPAAGIWAGSQKLEQKGEAMTYAAVEGVEGVHANDNDNNDEEGGPSKKART